MATEQIDLYAPDSKESTEVSSLNVRLPKKLHDDFTAMCKSRGVQPSKVVRRFLEREVQVAQMNDTAPKK